MKTKWFGLYPVTILTLILLPSRVLAVVSPNADVCCYGLYELPIDTDSQDEKDIKSYQYFSVFKNAQNCQPGSTDKSVTEGPKRTIYGTASNPDDCNSLDLETICKKAGKYWSKEDSKCFEHPPKEEEEAEKTPTQESN